MTQIHPTAVVAKDAQLHEDVVVGPLCVIGGNVSIGAGTVLDAHVTIMDGVTIGQGNHFFPNCAIGCAPQVLGADPTAKLGGLAIGDRNTIRENVTIHPSKYAGQATRIGSDSLLMVNAHVGHDCMVADNVVLSNCVQIGGHAHVEQGAWIAGMAASHQFVTIGRWCFVGGLTGLTQDVPPYLIVSGHYPPKVRGINKRGLKRAGLTEDRQERICEAYKRLYRRGGTLLANAEALAREPNLDENVRAIIDAIFKSSQHRFGRYLETLRK